MTASSTLRLWASAIPFVCYCKNDCTVSNASDYCWAEYDHQMDNEMDLLGSM